MSRLSKKERREIDQVQYSIKVQELRENSADVVAFAMANRKAEEFLTKDERMDLKLRIELRKKTSQGEQWQLDVINDAFQKDKKFRL